MDAAFEQALVARGAVLGQALGVRLPLRFAGLEPEWQAARSACAVWPASFRAFVSATGEDRVAFLHGMLSNDVKALAAGEGMRAAFLTQQGKIVADLRVLADADQIILDVFAARAEPFVTALSRFIVADDVELAAGVVQPLCGLSGPAARGILERILDRPPGAWRALHHAVHLFHTAPLRVVAASEYGDEGYLLCGAADLAPRVFDAACAAGATPIGMDTLDVLRIEAGVPWSGVDMDDEILIIEAGLEEAISFNKGCYLGQEVVERIAARGHVNKKLCGLLVEGAAPPSAGALLRADGRDVGRLTSVVRSPALDSIIALGYVHRDYLAPETRLEVVDGNQEGFASVTALPFAPTRRASNP